MNKLNQLSRAEMRKIMGGSPGNGGYTGDWCNGMTSFDCIVYYTSKTGSAGHTPQEYQVVLDGIENFCNYICSDTRPI